MAELESAKRSATELEFFRRNANEGLQNCGRLQAESGMGQRSYPYSNVWITVGRRPTLTAGELANLSYPACANG
jgi:hypothetical protein